MAIIYPIHKQFNDKIFNDDILYLQHKDCSLSRHKRYRKNFEFRTKLPKNLKTGDKIYVYETKKRRGCGKVIGEFTVGEIFPCNYAYGAYPFIAYFCRHILKNEDYAKKYERAMKVDLPKYKKGFIIKYALDNESMDFIEKYGRPPELIDYLYDKKRCENMDEAERVWKWTDAYLTAIGFFDDTGESNYKIAIEIKDPVSYAYPKELSDFKKLDGSIVEKAPQSFCYVEEI